MHVEENTDCLLSLPAAGVTGFKPWNPASSGFFVTSDPPGSQLGSGGGTAHLLHQAWQASPARPTGGFESWLNASRKLIVHGSGQSRRLPAYAAEGKPLLPLPLLPAHAGQAPDQRLIDFQLDAYSRILRHAPASYRVMITCGDVLLTNPTFTPAFPEADVLIVGIRSTPDEGSRHGVLFCRNPATGALDFFLQKPPPEKTRVLADSHAFYLDTGVWLLSARAVSVLVRKCGWSSETQTYAGGAPSHYELFDRFGLALGAAPVAPDPEISALSAAVLPLPAGRFFHFGTSRSIISSTVELAQASERAQAVGLGSAEAHEHCLIFNADLRVPLTGANRLLWIENSVIPAAWTLRDRHVLTGIPDNTWALDLPAGVCLDCIGLRDEAGVCLRVYGFDDPFRGALSDPATRWMERPLADWLKARGISCQQAGLAPHTDIQDAPLFPRLAADDPRCGPLLAWMTALRPAADPASRRLWLDAPRVSAADLLCRADTAARATARSASVDAVLARLSAQAWQKRCLSLDLEAVARRMEGAPAAALPPPLESQDRHVSELAAVHDVALRDRLAPAAGRPNRAAGRLRELLVAKLAVAPVSPRRAVGEDQIVWGRAPARLDFAGGWTDTPPYCLEHGGRVVNLAVNLNGQPPVQAFARVCEKPCLVIRSIDLGVGEVIETTEDLLAEERLGSGFGIARAAFRLAGFDPAFNASGRAAPLGQFLRDTFGGGIELTLLAAIPKGSGLGTSSILAATLLGTLGDLAGLQWNEQDLFIRTLALEQILTSGGGWQDQVGGIVGGLKQIESAPGLQQKPVIRWLPTSMLDAAIADRRFQLYYTGLTRVAHNILGEIVKGLFLNDAERIRTIDAIGLNADFAAEALQRHDWPVFVEAIRRSWLLNRMLDIGTNPPEVQAIIDRVSPWLAATKLTGAGGGGYMLLLADTPEQGARLRRELLDHPPNGRARFVDVSLSHTGLEITRS
jgi:galactokinase/mevalonate kinase-like predicted kinase